MLVAGVEGAGEVEPGDRPAAALAVAVVQGDHDGGAVVAVDEARRDDADHAGVPLLLPEHDRAATVAGRASARDHLLDRLLEDLPLDRLALAVLLLEVRRRSRSALGCVGGGEHLDREPRVAHPAAGVEPRGEQEADVVAVERSGR